MRYVQIKLHGETLSAERKQQLMAAIQAALVAVTGNDDIPACIAIDEVPDANWGLLGLQEPVHDAGEQEGKAGSGRLPVLTGLVQQGTFTYQSDFDGKGVVAHLAGGFGAGFRNPAQAGVVAVSSSPLLLDSQPAWAVVGNEVVRCCTKPNLKSWFEIDFKQFCVMPTYYSLRHYSSWDAEALRTWVLEGSPDGNAWHVLRRHENDTALSAKGATHTWPISDLWPGMFFRYFRITQEGLNSNNHHYLALSGFEVYGQLAKVGVQAPSNGVSAINKMVLNSQTMARLRGSLLR